MATELVPGDEDGDLPLADRDVSLVDLLDRLLAGGVVLTGDLTLAIADVDLVHISLRALITSVRPDVPSPWER
ncbi:gas vesicle protein [Actinoalloteichus spitiensis]|uniref:gas vesicle protein n=1 Tax=Actinoalloteichus spitiensis TaxID=252394 RepID=UPI00036D94E4|nr:gas vesicle protein [Actinoalloteichus spitiensis]